MEKILIEKPGIIDSAVSLQRVGSRAHMPVENNLELALKDRENASLRYNAVLVLFV